MLNILFLASSTNSSNDYPLCLQEYEGITILQYFKEKNLNNIDAKYTFVFQKKDMKQYRLNSIAKVLDPNANIIALEGSTGGSACTALYAACQLEQDIPLLIISTNEIVKQNYNEVLNFFDKNLSDGGVMTFNSVHPRYSYVKLVNSKIIEFCQQNPISHYATTGSFWFKKTSYFVESSKKSIFNNCVTSNNFYIAPVYNQMILSDMKIDHYDVTGKYIPFKADLNQTQKILEPI